MELNFIKIKMKIKFIIVVFVIFSLAGYSQDSTWKKTIIDETLTVSFPGEVEVFDTTVLKEKKKWRIKVYKYEEGQSAFGLIVTPGETDINVDNKESWKEALKGMSKGAMKSFLNKGINCAPGDTIVDGIPCVKLSCKNEDYSLIKQYLFLVNDKLYALQYSSINMGNISFGRDRLDMFLKSIHFKKEGIKEMQFESKAFSDGYKIGYFLGGAGMLALLIIGVIFFVRKFKL